METSSALYELASVSLACRDQDTLLKTFAARVGAVLGARAVFVWTYDTESEGLVCRTRWTEPGERIAPLNDPVGDGLLFEIYESGGSRLIDAETIAGIRVPVLIVGNDQDFVHPLAYAERLQQILPHANLRVITSKSINKDQYRREFREALGWFLSGML